MPLAQYTTSKQKKIARLFEKDIFKVVTSTDILNNIQTFNFYFIDKVKHVSTDQAYEKCQLVI